MPDRLRVAFVIDGALDQKTGGYLYDRLVIDGLRERSIHVDVVSLDADKPASIARENARILRLLNQDKPRHDVIVIDELCHPRATIAALLRPRHRSAPRLVTLLHHLAASERSGLSASVRLPLERALLSASDHVIVTSETTRRVAMAKTNLPAERLTVVCPGRDRLGTRDKPPPSSEGRPIRFLFLGALTPRKDPVTLLRAFERISHLATLTLAGPADRDPLYAAEVLREASRFGSRVRLLGEVSDDDLRVQLSTHDALVLPSHYEGFGIVLAEAASFGLAIVSSHVGAIPEVVRADEDALLIPPGDARALAGALSKLASDPAYLVDMQRRALRRAASLPNWADTRARFCQALDGLSARHFPRP